MSDAISKPYRGYCPEVDRDRDVDVWHKIDVKFRYSQFGHFVGSSCPDASSCQYLKEHDDCPLLNEVNHHYNLNVRDSI